MTPHSPARITEPDPLRRLTTLVARERENTANLLAHLAEFDKRRLYQPAGYPSMYAYCVGELHMAEDSALELIQAARTARRFPVIFPAIADGRIQVEAVCLLAPFLTEATVDGLLAAAAHKTHSEVEQLVARRPGPD